MKWCLEGWTEIFLFQNKSIEVAGEKSNTLEYLRSRAGRRKGTNSRTN